MILLIDDSDHERAIIRKMLESGGHEVGEASNGDEAASRFGALAPSLVLCDLMMPHKDGLATIAEIQALAPGTKIVAMSGVWYGQADRAGMAKALGLVAVIEKPFTRAGLLNLVGRALQPKAAKAGRAKSAGAKSRSQSKPKAKPKAKSKSKPKAAARSRKVAKRPAAPKRRPQPRRKTRRKPRGSRSRA